MLLSEAPVCVDSSGESNMSQLRFTAAAKSMTGQRRGLNEDSFFVADDLSLIVVADGLGGHSGGEVASNIVVSALDCELSHQHVSGPETALITVNQALTRTNTKILETAAAQPEIGSARSTVVMGLRCGETLYVKGRGDSRAYLLREATLIRLTTDHTLAHMLVAVGGLSPEFERTHPQRNILLRCMGQHDFDAGPDLITVDLQGGDRVLFCSDGLHGCLDDTEIGRIVSQTTTPDEAITTLVHSAISAEHSTGDDITCVALFIGP